MQTQRWRHGRDRYRPAGEVIATREYDVASLVDDETPKAFITTHHYSRSYPAARFRYGLYRHGALVGVAVYSHPCNNAVLTNVFPGDPRDAVELGRFVLLDEVPGNGETWFLARTFEQLRKEVRGVVSFSDPVPRARADGSVMFAGHLGTIYQAHNAAYLGRGTARMLRILPDGTVFNERAISKIRKQERGWRYSAAILERFGAPPPTGDLSVWLKTWLPRLTRPLRHSGNHRYAWSFTKHTFARQPYPKRML
jgi:hypothetical protein